MKAIDTARFILYRVHEKGLEVFLIKDENDDMWKLPHGAIKALVHKDSHEVIELDTAAGVEGDFQTLAIEADWHEIPSIRALIKHDINVVTSKLTSKLPSLDHGAFFVIKEGIKKTLPEEYLSLIHI